MIQSITVDLIPNGKMPMLHASQYDDGRQVRINLTENRQAYTLTGNEVLSLAVRKADNTLVTMDIANTYGGKSYVEFATTEQMCAVAGLNFGELTITNNGTKVGSLNFYLACEPSPEAGGLRSASEINNLNRQIDDHIDEVLPEMVEDIAPAIVEEVAPAVVREVAPSVVEDVAPAILDRLAPSAVAEAAPAVVAELVPPAVAEVAPSVVREVAPPIVEELVPIAVGDNYYNKSQTDEKIGDLIDDTETLGNKTWSGQKINNAILDVLPQSSASGSIANFNTSLDLPLLSIIADIVCTKSGNVISGYDNVVLTHYSDDIADADTITIPLLTDEYGGELIITDKGNGYASVKKKITKKRYNLSNISFTQHSNGFWIGAMPEGTQNCDANTKPDILAENYEPQTATWIYSHGNTYGYLGQNGNLLWITYSVAPNGYMVANLATPIITDLPDIPSILAFVGENNISANCGYINISYKLGLSDELEAKADKSDTYTKTQVNEMIAKVDDQGIYVQSKLNSLSSPTTFAPKIDNKKNAVIEFIGYFSSFTSLTFGHGYGSISGSWIVVDDTNLTVYYSAPAQVKAQVAHGLTISDFIHVTVQQLNNAHADITITTASGDYTLTNAVWVGCQGVIYANVGSTINDVVINAVYRDFNEKLFLYGDSYVSLDDPARYPYYLIKNGYTHFLLDGWAGRASSDALLSFKNTVALVVPKYIIWAIGMNNADNGAVNPTWLADTQELLQICAAKGITPILTVTPCTPTVDNAYKNAWVKASGYRYIDFAKAVGAESAGSSWYTGMLYSDNVHPTALGAKALYARLITDAPEIIK